MALPRPGDVLIRRGGATTFEVVEAISHHHLATHASYSAAFAFAQKQPGSIWQQSIDNRGRPLADPILVLPRTGRISHSDEASK